MLDYIKKAMREHLALTALIGVLAPFTTISLFSLFFASEREIVYELNEVFSQCGLSTIPGRDCAALYELIIGNTGAREEAVHMAWPFDLSPWERSHQVLNIAADEPRNHDPRITCETSGTRSECVVENFSPGALVIMKLSCLACSGQDLGRMEARRVDIETSAPVSWGDPRATLVFRRLWNLLDILWR